MFKILSNEQIEEIKVKYKSGSKQMELANEYQVSVMTINLWIRDNPYEIIKLKKRKKIDYSKMPRCKICTRILKSIDEICDCKQPKKYYNDFQDLIDIYNENSPFK